MQIGEQVKKLRLHAGQVSRFIKMFFRQWDYLPEFLRRLRGHFAEAVMGATISGIGIFVVALFTSLSHWVWLLVLITAFFFSAYAVFREEYIKGTGRQPQIIYDHADEVSVKHGDGRFYAYTHLWFCNQPRGRPARAAAARITVWDSSDKQLFSVEGKWMEVPHDLGRGIHGVNKIDLLPNNAAHGLDLLIRAPGAEDCYGLHVASHYRGARDPGHRVSPGTSKVKVMLACEGYSEDFWFEVRNDGQAVEVQQQIAPKLSPTDEVLTV